MSIEWVLRCAMHSRLTRIGLAVALALGDGGCSNASTTADVVDAAADVDATVYLTCPPTQPDRGSACATEGMECGYGADLYPDCRANFTCHGRRFLENAPCVPPASFGACAPSAQGTSCSDAYGMCNYEDILERRAAHGRI